MAKSIREIVANIKQRMAWDRTYLNVVIIILACTALSITSFNLGRFSALSERENTVYIEMDDTLATPLSEYAKIQEYPSDTINENKAVSLVASKNGTKYY